MPSPKCSFRPKNRSPVSLTFWRACCMRADVALCSRRGGRFAIAEFCIKRVAWNEVARRRTGACNRGHVDAQEIADARFVDDIRHWTEATHSTVAQQQRLVGKQRN